MGQPSLQVGLNTPAVSGDNKLSSDRTAVQNESEVKPFSSTLNEQLEKPSEHNNKAKKVDSVDKKQEKEDIPAQDEATVKNHEKAETVSTSESEKNESSDAKAEQSADEGGNNLPVVDVEVARQAENESGEQADGEELSAAETDTVNIANSQTSYVDDSKEASIAITQSNANKSTASTTLNNDESSSNDSATELKPALRSDILHAILNKKGKQLGSSKEGAGADFTKELSSMGQKHVEVPVNERQKMAKLFAASKAEGNLVAETKNPLASTFSSTLTSMSAASTSSSSPLTPLASQTTSVGQSVFSMQPSVQSEAWGKVLSSRVVWMAREGVQQAELRLNPAKLGPVEVKLHMNNDQANVTFVAQNAATRDALEQALPRLKESFQENGMNLANADVSDQASGQQAEEDGAGEASPNNHDKSLQTDGGDHEQEQDEVLSSLDDSELGVSVFA